jgi:phosphoribosyl 1,2-cyclic phosphate phosphodiesterase
MMRVTFLGTGTSQGVPMIGCTCGVCLSLDSRDKRLRTSIKIETSEVTLVIDSGPDFRQQMLTSKTAQLHAVVFTHEHKDHIAGLDDIRAFNYFQKEPMHVYCDKRVETALRREFHYAFNELKYPGAPDIQIHAINASEDFRIGDLTITPIEVMHYKLPVLGFRINDFVYITDANFISEKEKEKLKNCKALVLNALRKEPHISHFTLNEAIQLAQDVQAPLTYFTHISHQLGCYAEVSEALPESMHLAYDGLELNFPINEYLCIT